MLGYKSFKDLGIFNSVKVCWTMGYIYINIYILFKYFLKSLLS